MRKLLEKGFREEIDLAINYATKPTPRSLKAEFTVTVGQPGTFRICKNQAGSTEDSSSSIIGSSSSGMSSSSIAICVWSTQRRWYLTRLHPGRRRTWMVTQIIEAKEIKNRKRIRTFWVGRSAQRVLEVHAALEKSGADTKRVPRPGNRS